jgi:hypothetical protein
VRNFLNRYDGSILNIAVGRRYRLNFLQRCVSAKIAHIDAARSFPSLWQHDLAAAALAAVDADPHPQYRGKQVQRHEGIRGGIVHHGRC